MKNKVLVLASGPSVKQVNDYDFKGSGWTVAVVNNACHAYSEFDYWVYPEDFCGEKPMLTENQKEIKEAQYVPSLEKYGGQGECTGKGAGNMTLNALYWTLDNLNPDIIGILGADMNYEPRPNGETAFYGVGYDIRGKTRSRAGKPDPFFQAARSRNRGSYTPREFLIYLFARFLVHAKQQNTRVVNFSNDAKSLLPYEKLDPNEV